MDWHLLQAVVTDKLGKVAFRSVEFGGNIVAADEGNPIESHSIESLFSTSGYTPDIIKLDVESYEYDVLLGAVDWLKPIALGFFWNCTGSNLKTAVSIQRIY